MVYRDPNKAHHASYPVTLLPRKAQTMKMPSLLPCAALTALLCFALVLPAPAAQNATKAAAPAKKSASAKAAAPSKKAPRAARQKAEASPEDIQKQFEAFALETVGKLNRHALPSLGKKEVKQNADGSFTARYIEIDPASIKTSYKKPETPGGVTYLGYMSYNEAEYACTAASKAEAEKGPFSVKRAKMLTEIVKYVNGKWTY